MKHAPIVALALAAAFIAGCGGGGDSITRAQYDELQGELDDANDQIDDLEDDLADETARANREEGRANTAEGQLEGEQTARREAEERADDLEEEAQTTADQLVQANARRVFNGLDDAIQVAAGGTDASDPTVTPRYGQSALVSTVDPAVTFSSVTTSTSNKWRKTSFSNRAFDFTNRLDVYNDAEAPEHVPFRDSVYNDGVAANEVPNTAVITIVDLYRGSGPVPAAIIDSQGDVVGSLDLNGDIVSGVVSSPFPRSGDGAKSFTLVNRGKYTTEQRRRSLLDTTDSDYFDIVTDNGGPYTGAYRNAERYPLQYTYEVGGSLAGASGTFTCASAAAAGGVAPPSTTCRVTNQNTHFTFAGPWVFTPSASARVRVDDAEFMYFGWWARQDNSDGSWTYLTFHGPSAAAGNRSTADQISQLSGTATYVGPAVGQYSFYEPLGSNSEYGEFTARATLRANFTAAGVLGTPDETVSGTIDQFDGHPDWTLTLKQKNIANGVIPTVANETAVSWSIENEATAAPDSGTWEAAFYSNLPADQRGGTGSPDEDAVPTGMAGTFEASYHHVGRIIGAFGAHKQP